MGPQRLRHAQVTQLQDFLLEDTVGNLFPLSWLQNHGVEPDNGQRFSFWGLLHPTREVRAMALSLADRLILLDTRDEKAALKLGRFFRDREHHLSHIVGRAPAVRHFWRAYSEEALGAFHPEPRLIQEQELYALRPPEFTAPACALSTLRRVEPSELDALFLASARMHREETGEDPLEIDADAFRRQVRYRIHHGRAFVVFDEHRHLIFKADLSTRSHLGVQISGVYTEPRHRGQGLASAALRDLCALLFEEGVPLITLYVNRTNAPAIRVYKRLGFQFEGPYQTIFIAD